MPSGNFEKAGIQLEVAGFTTYIENLNKVDDAHIRVGGSADALAEKLTNLEKIVGSVLKSLTNIRIDANAMGITQVGKDMDQAGNAAGEFSKDMSEAAQALRKLEAISGTLEVFDRLTQTLIQNTGSLKAGFDNIQAAIRDIDLAKLADQAGTTAVNIGKLATEMKRLEDSMGGNKLVSNLGKLIPLLLAAGDIRSLGDVGRGIGSILSQLTKIDKIPNFDKNQKNFNALIVFVEKLSKLKISGTLGTELADIGAALVKFAPGIVAINKVDLKQHTLDGIEQLLKTFQTFSGIDLTGFKPLADGISAISKAFRSFGASDAGSRFTGAAKDIAEAVQILLTALNTFVSQSNSSALIKLIGELGIALKSFAQGASGLGRNFDNTFGNMGKTTEIIIDSLVKLSESFSKFDNLPSFVVDLTTIAKAVEALSTAFQKISRSESIRTHLRQQIIEITDALGSLSREELQVAAKNIEALVGPITHLAEALKLLKGQKIAKGLADNINQVGGGFEKIIAVGSLVANVLGGISRALLTLTGTIGKLALTGLVNGFKILFNILSTLGSILIKLPLQAIVIGFNAISFAVQAVVVPIRFLISLLGSLGNAFLGLFKNKSANISASLGLKEAQADISEFDNHMDSLRGSFNQVNSTTNTAKGGLLDFGQAANKATTEVAQLDQRMDSLGTRTSLLSRLFGGGELLKLAGTFKLVDIAGDLVTDTLYNITYGFTNLIGQAVTATSKFEQLTLQLTSLQAKEAVSQGLFPDVPTALSKGVDLLKGNVTELINEFRILAIQSPFETSDVANAFRLAQSFGFATDQARELTRTLVDAGSALGFTGQDLTEVTRVFGQIRTTGKLMAQDMNQLASRGINVKKILEEVNGATIDWDHATIDAGTAIDAVIHSLQHDFAGAAARSADSIEGLLGSFRSFKEEALRTFAQPIVEGLRPLFVGLADVLFKTEIFDKITAAGQKAFQVIENIVVTIASIAGAVSNVFSAIPQPLIDFITLLGEAAGVAAAATVALIGLEFAIGAVAAIVGFLLNPFGALAAAIFLTSAAVTHFTDDLMGVKEILRSLGQIIANAFNLQTVETQILLISQLPKNVEPIAVVINDLTVKFSKLLSVLKIFGGIFIEAFRSGTEFTTPIINSLESLDISFQSIGLRVANVGVFFRNLYNSLVQIAQGIYSTVSDAFNNLGASIGNAFTYIVNSTNTVIESLGTMANNVSTFLSSLIQQVGDFGVGVVEAFAGGMQSAVNLVVQAVTAIADAISWLLSPGSPPRALPDIDKWGTAAASEFIGGFSEADTSSILDLANSIQDSLGSIRLPENSSLSDILGSMNWHVDDAGNIVDSFNNMIMTQDQLAKSAGHVADELERVNAELAALDKAQNIQKQQNLVNNLKAALKQPGISESNRMVLEQQLQRAELELKRLQLEAEQKGIDTGKGGLGGGSSSGGSKDAKAKKLKEEKIPKEPEQKVPKIKTTKAKKGKAGKELLDLQVPDTSPIEAAFGDSDKGTGLLGRVQKAFEDAKTNIGTAVGGIKDTLVNIFTSIRDELKIIIDEIVRLAGEFGQAFSDAFGTIENQGPIVGGIAALATATVLTGGWEVLGIIATGITALGLAWAVASGQVTLDLPDSLQVFQEQIDKMKAGFAGASTKTMEVSPGVSVIIPGKTLAESIMGFSITDFSTSLGALLSSLGETVAGFFVAIDKAIGDAIVAQAAGGNPVLAFFDSLFNVKDIRVQIEKEVAEIGKVVTTILSGQLSTLLSAQNLSTSDTVRSQGTGSFIADFIIAQINNAANILGSFDIAGAFTDFKTNLSDAFGGIFSSGVDATGTPTGEPAFLTQLKSIVSAIGDIAKNSGDWTKFTSDLGELGKSLQQFGSVAVPVGIGLIISAISSIITAIAEAPGVAQSATQIINDAFSAISNLATAIKDAATGNFAQAATDLGESIHNFVGIFKEMSDIDAGVVDVLNSFFSSIATLVRAANGVADPAQFDETTKHIVGLATTLGNALVKMAEAQFLASLPKIVTLKGSMNEMVLVVGGISLLASALEDYQRDHPDVHTEGIVKFLNSISNVALVLTGIQSLTGIGGATIVLNSMKGLITGIIEIVNLIIIGKGLSPEDVGVAGTVLGKIFLWTKATLVPIISGIVEAIGGAIAGVSVAAVVAWSAIILAIVGTLIGLVTAFNEDIGGIKTDFLNDWNNLVGSITKMWDGLVGMFTHIGDPKAREAAAKEFNEGWKSILGNLWAVISYIVPGTTNNTELIMSTIQGFVSFFDGIFGTNFAQNFANFFDPIRASIDQLGSVGAVAERGFDNIILMIGRFLAIQIQPLDGLIIRLLGVVDAIRNFGNLNLERVGVVIQLLAELTAFAANPLMNLGRIPTIAGLIQQFQEIGDTVEPLDSFAESYKTFIEGLRTTQFVQPKIQVEPEFIGPLQPGQKRDSKGFPSLFGLDHIFGEDKTTTVPIAFSPEFSTDNTTLNTALSSMTTDTTTALTGLNTTVGTNTAALQTQVTTGYAAIATTIGQAGVDGSAGFVTGMGTLPTDVKVPLDATVAALDAYGGDKGQFTLAGAGLGEDFATGYIAGIDSKKDELIGAVTAYVNAGLIVIPKVQKSSSPSKVTRGFGRDAGEGYLKGWHDKQSKLQGVVARFAQAGVDQVVKTTTSPKNQAAIKRVIDALLPDVFKDKGLKIDFSKWEIVSDSETDVKKRATDSATDIASEFGNEFARVTNQVFDELISNDPSLAPDFFNNEDINKKFDEELTAILKHRDDTLAQLSDEGKKQFDRNFLAAFTDPEGLKRIADDFLQQFSDEDLMNVPKVFGAVDKFLADFRSRLEEKAKAGDGFAMSMLGGLDKFGQTLNDELQKQIDAAAAEANGTSTQDAGASVGETLVSNVAAGTTSNASLGGLNDSVTTVITALSGTIETEFTKITAIITGQGQASSTGFITGVDTVSETLPTTMGDIVDSFKGYADDFYVAGQKLGKQFADGYISGIMLRIQALDKAAQDMIAHVKEATKLAQDSKSPSKVAMELGKDFADGYIIGITNATSEVSAASMAMVNAATAPIIENSLPGSVKTGTFWIDESIKHGDTLDNGKVDDTTESMNKLERATETAKSIFDAFGNSFNNTFDSVLDKFLELNPDAITNIWDIEPIREAGTQVAQDLLDTLNTIGKQLSPSGQGKFSELISQLFGDPDTIAALVQSFVDSFDPEDLANLPDAAGAIDTFIHQIEDVFLENKDLEGFLKDKGLTGDVANGLKGITEQIKAGIQKALDDINNETDKSSSETNSWLEDMFGTADPTATEHVGEALAAGVAEGATSPSSITAIQSAAQEAMDAYITALRDAGQIHSPSKLTMRMVGEPLADGLIVGMRNRLPSIISTARTIGDTVANSFGSGGEWLQRNTFDQKVNLKYNGLVNSLPELFQHVNSKLVGSAGKLGDNIMLSGNSSARTGMLTNYSVINNTNNTQDEYHLHMDVDKNQLGNVRRGFRVARQLGIK